MNCRRCRKKFPAEQNRCPHCGETNPNTAGVFQTSTVLIASGSGRLVYRSVEEVPGSLREKLVKSTNSANSATILIADRRGRREIARVMRNVPGSTQRRLVQAILGQESVPDPADWLTKGRKRALLAFLLLSALALIAVALTRH
jgi:hypothetical protein